MYSLGHVYVVLQVLYISWQLRTWWFKFVASVWRTEPITFPL